jgi:hypothetical protein
LHELFCSSNEIEELYTDTADWGDEAENTRRAEARRKAKKKVLIGGDLSSKFVQ